MKLSTKIFAVVALPALFFLIATAILVRQSFNERENSIHTRLNILFIESLSEVVGNVQKERGISTNEKANSLRGWLQKARETVSAKAEVPRCFKAIY